MECGCCKEVNAEDYSRLVRADMCNGASGQIVVDIIAQGEKGEKGDGAELTDEQMENLADKVTGEVFQPIPEDELQRML